MRIAILLSDVSYPPREGLHQQSTMLASELQSRGHTVTVFTYGRSTLFDAERFAAETGVEVVMPPRRVHAGALTGALQSGLPGSKAWTAQRYFAKRLHDGRFDAVHLEGALASAVPVRLPTHARVVMSWVDLGSSRYARLSQRSSGMARLKNVLAGVLYLGFEKRAAKRWRVWHFVSSSDAKHSQHRWPNVRAIIIPPMVPARLYELEAVPVPQDVLVFADLRQRYVRDAYLRYMAPAFQAPELAKRVRWKILGRVPADPELRSVEGDSLVEYLEWVDDYAQELKRARMVVLPDGIGSGIKNRFLQSLALGCVTIATPTAAEGVPAEDGKHFSSFDSPDDLPRLIARHLDHAQDDETLSSNAKLFARRAFHPEAVTSAWIYEYGRHDD
ncbi:glycosyltransferase [Microbacterium testaceum]|uniref:glycosyltransferase n=1 Tax=Microbacterium testaceum TaxID=2033 RepID=UPI00128F580F|nr:glycosyltransferase [Microbacterium testaceum]